jgi:hypothetical protein
MFHQLVVKEPGADDPRHFRERVNLLAATYCALFVLSIAGIVLLIWQGQLFVTLTQRSNVETLVLAFFVVFFGYLVLLSAPGVLGTLRILWFAVRRRVTRDALQIEQAKMRALGQRQDRTAAELNVIVEVDDQPGLGVEIPVQDAAGRMGILTISGTRIEYVSEHRDGSNEVLAFVARQLDQMLQARASDAHIDIVAWKKIDDEASEQYHGIVEFARNLERQLGKGDLWPKARITRAEQQQLEARLSEICPALRDEGFLPHWDYQAEHKLPIIPEPLGLITLNRTEARVDPVSSMGCAVIVVFLVVVVLALFIAVPPWVPGT